MAMSQQMVAVDLLAIKTARGRARRHFSFPQSSHCRQETRAITFPPLHRTTNDGDTLPGIIRRRTLPSATQSGVPQSAPHRAGRRALWEKKASGDCQTVGQRRGSQIWGRPLALVGRTGHKPTTARARARMSKRNKTTDTERGNRKNSSGELPNLAAPDGPGFTGEVYVSGGGGREGRWLLDCLHRGGNGEMSHPNSSFLFRRCWTKKSRKGKGHRGLGLVLQQTGEGWTHAINRFEGGSHQWGPGLRFSRAR